VTTIKIKLRKTLDEIDKKEIIDHISKEFGSIERLEQKVSRTGCREPKLVDKLMILKYLREGAEYKTERILSSAKPLSVITHRRVSLMEHLSKEKVRSIRDLADELNRDYKNVYDDVNVLFENGLLDLEKDGKRRVPTLNADNILIEF